MSKHSAIRETFRKRLALAEKFPVLIRKKGCKTCIPKLIK